MGIKGEEVGDKVSKNKVGRCMKSHIEVHYLVTELLEQSYIVVVIYRWHFPIPALLHPKFQPFVLKAIMLKNP